MAAAVAVDNDILLKALSYGLEGYFWPEEEERVIGVLGAARFVLSDRLAKAGLKRGSCADALKHLLHRAEILEPEKAEVDLAAAVERRASELGFELDGGESQLAAVVVTRGFESFETGDKRAIAGLEPMVNEITSLGALCGRVRCLEQIAHRLAAVDEDFPHIAEAICGEADVDRSLSTCFSCYSGLKVTQDSVLEALLSYIKAVRESAPTVLEAGP